MHTTNSLSNVEEKRKERYLFLRRLYEITDANEHKWVNMWELGKQLGYDEENIEKIAMYLAGENLIEFQALGGIIGITHWGIKEVEQSMIEPDKPTIHFPAINLINIQTMTDSQIVQGNVIKNENISKPTLILLQDILNDTQNILHSCEIDKDKLSELNIYVQSIKGLTELKEPKQGTIKESIRSMKELLSNIPNCDTSSLINKISGLYHEL